jgi:hypothetical protein
MTGPRLTSVSDQAWAFAAEYSDHMEPLAKKLLAGDALTAADRMLAAACLMNVPGEVRKRQYEAGDAHV